MRHVKTHMRRYLEGHIGNGIPLIETNAAIISEAAQVGKLKEYHTLPCFS